MTLRVPCPQGEALDWSEQTLLAVRYADTGEPVPLTSDYQQGWLFATVPAEEAERPLEVFQGEEHRFPDCITVWKGHEYYNDPGGAKELYLRGVLQGDHAGNLNPDAALTRAEAFALICRLLSLEPGGDPGYADAEPGDWYYDTASAAVSSQELSIASIVISFFSLIFLPPLCFRKLQIHAHPVFPGFSARENPPYFIHVLLWSCQ